MLAAVKSHGRCLCPLRRCHGFAPSGRTHRHRHRRALTLTSCHVNSCLPLDRRHPFTTATIRSHVTASMEASCPSDHASVIETICKGEHYWKDKTKVISHQNSLTSLYYSNNNKKKSRFKECSRLLVPVVHKSLQERAVQTQSFRSSKQKAKGEPML